MNYSEVLSPVVTGSDAKASTGSRPLDDKSPVVTGSDAKASTGACPLDVLSPAEAGSAPKGATGACPLDDNLPTANDTLKNNSSDLVATIARARALLDDGDLAAARILSGAAYEQAKAASTHAARVQAGMALRQKANRLQADALLIDARVQIAIVNAVERGQAAGAIAAKGRPKVAHDDNVTNGNIYTLEDLGIDRFQLSHSRKLRDAEAKEPSLVERAIAARLQQGFAPTRTNLRAAIGTASAPAAERGDDLYETPEIATRALLRLEVFPTHVLEPACGRGAITRVLEHCGHDVVQSDLVDRGTADKHGECQHVCDFLALKRDDLARTPDAIITNPPYGRAVMNAFIAHALKEFRPSKMAMLLQWNALAGFDDDDRVFWRDQYKPARIYLFTRRLPMMHRDGWDGPLASSRMNTCWVVWDADAPDASTDFPYGQSTELHTLDWGTLFEKETQA